MNKQEAGKIVYFWGTKASEEKDGENVIISVPVGFTELFLTRLSNSKANNAKHLLGPRTYACKNSFTHICFYFSTDKLGIEETSIMVKRLARKFAEKNKITFQDTTTPSIKQERAA